MKTKQLVLKIVACVLSALFILPLFLNFLGYRVGDFRNSYTYAEFNGITDPLIVIARVLYIISLVLAMILLVSLVLQFIFKYELIDWFVIGSAVLCIICASLSFVSALLYCVSISNSNIIWYPQIGCYVILFLGLVTPVIALISNRK